MSHIRCPTVYGLYSLLMQVSLGCTGELSHDLSLVQNFCSEYGINPDLAVDTIHGNFPSTATATVH